MKKIFLVFTFAILSSLYSVQIPAHHIFPTHPTVIAPWFTGPLLAPSPITIPPGHANIEPYIYAFANVGKYDNHWNRQKTETFWSNFCQVSTQFGINSWLDFSLYPTLFYNYTHGAGKWAIGDMPVGFDIQLYNHNKVLTDWGTALSFRIQEILPIGKYRNLNPAKKATDVGGQGSWQTVFGLVWGNLFYIGGNRFITWRNAFQYTLPAPVHVKNLNAYGGGAGTNGTVYPAQNFQFDTAIEITLTKNWVFAMDILSSWSKKVRFKGKTLDPNFSPSAVQISLAPAIEYNWSSSIGLIFGCWFTVAGRNADQFINGVIAFNYFR